MCRSLRFLMVKEGNYCKGEEQRLEICCIKEFIYLLFISLITMKQEQNPVIFDLIKILQFMHKDVTFTKTELPVPVGGVLLLYF